MAHAKSAASIIADGPTTARVGGLRGDQIAGPIWAAQVVARVQGQGVAARTGRGADYVVWIADRDESRLA